MYCATYKSHSYYYWYCHVVDVPVLSSPVTVVEAALDLRVVINSRLTIRDHHESEIPYS